MAVTEGVRDYYDCIARCPPPQGWDQKAVTASHFNSTQQLAEANPAGGWECQRALPARKCENG